MLKKIVQVKKLPPYYFKIVLLTVCLSVLWKFVNLSSTVGNHPKK